MPEPQQPRDPRTFGRWSNARIRKLEQRFEVYVREHTRKWRGRDRHLALETMRRFKQALWCLLAARTAQRTYLSLLRRQDRMIASLHQHSDVAKGRLEIERTAAGLAAQRNAMWTLTEAFYYFAWKYQGLAKRHLRLHGVESTEIRDMRNHSIEHTDGRAGIWVESFMWNTGALGPMVKPPLDDQTGRKLGLYVHAVEMFDRLERALTHADA